MRTARTLMMVLSMTVALAVSGCKSDCEKLYNHTIEVAEKDGLAADKLEAMKGDAEKKAALDACAHEPVKSVRCGIVAENLDGLRRCRPHPASN